MLKFISVEILDKVKPFNTNILFKFDDNEISKDEYAFLKTHIDNFNLFITDEYSMTSETQYDESSGILLIGINIIIPDHLMPKDDAKVKQIIDDHSNRFQNFYERRSHHLPSQK